MDPQIKIVLYVSLAAAVLYVIGCILWIHGVFCRHDWDTSRICTDLCRKCGRIRFKV